MNTPSKKSSLILLGVTSLLISRGTFALINDPEGPNLLIVVGLALVLYLPSLAAYSFYSSASSIKKLFYAVFVQVVVALGLYLLFV